MISKSPAENIVEDRIESGRAYVLRILERILELNAPWWFLQLGSDHPGLIFVQGEREADGSVRLELVNQDVAGRPLGLNEVIAIAENDWDLPRGRVPHYYQFLDDGNCIESEVAQMLLRSLELVYHVLQPGVHDATITVRPSAVAEELGIDYGLLIDVADDEESGDTYMTWEPSELKYLEVKLNESSSEAGVTIVTGDDDSANGSNNEWFVSSLDELYAFCDSTNLPRVSLPNGIGPLYRHRDFDVWSNSEEASPWFVYSFGQVGPNATDFAHFTRLSRESLFMFGVAGHGIKSYGLGLVVRTELFALAIQTGWGLAYRSHADTPKGAFMVSAWNQALVALEHCSPEDGSLILFSNFREICRIFGYEPDPDDEFWSPEGNSGGGQWEHLGPWWVPLLQDPETTRAAVGERQGEAQSVGDVMVMLLGLLREHC